MSEDPLRDVIEGFRTRLQAELDAQLRTLTDHQAETVERVRRATEADADERWTATLEQHRAEWTGRLDREVTAAREDAERATAAESMRVRLELEQQAAETAGRVRREIEESFAAERRQAAEAIEAERVNAAHAVAQAVAQAALQAQSSNQERQHVEEALEAERVKLEAEREKNVQATSRLQAALAQVQQAEQTLEAERARTLQTAAQVQAATEELQQVTQALLEERARNTQAMAQLQTVLQERQQAEEERRRLDETTLQARSAFEAERAQFEQNLSAARADLDAERLKYEQTLAEARTGVEAEKRGVEQTLAEARASAESDRRAAQHAIEQARADADSKLREIEATLAQVRADLEAEKRAAEQLRAEQAQTSLDVERTRAADVMSVQPGLAASPDLTDLVGALRSITQSESLTAALAAAVKAAASVAPRAALFIVDGAELQEWAVAGVPALSTGLVPADGGDAGLLMDALRGHEPVWSDGNGGGRRVPAFASLPSGRSAIAAPVVLGGEAVAVLYADDGVEGTAAALWRDSIQILASHASACLSYLTAARTAQAMRLLNNPTASATSPASSADDDHGAHRYARLLLSEIRLYNEAEVSLGRQNRDLMRRLKPEIERARRLYEERVSASVAGRDRYFQQELVHTLADGDAALLG